MAEVDKGIGNIAVADADVASAIARVAQYDALASCPPFQLFGQAHGVDLEPLWELEGDQVGLPSLDEGDDLGDMEIYHRDEKKGIRLKGFLTP
jgi:hypothetical protein